MSLREGTQKKNNQYVEIPIRTIAAYFNQPTYAKTYPRNVYYDCIGTRQAGIFPLFGQVYLETGDNIRRHFGVSDNGGGAPRNRICTIITQENQFLWGVGSIKNRGITSFCGNHLIVEEFKKINEDGSMGETLYDYLFGIYQSLRGFHSKKIKAQKGDLDYYKVNGFKDKERVAKDIEDFKTKATKEANCEVYYPPITSENPKNMLYSLTKKSGFVYRTFEEGEVKYSLNLSNVGTNYNECSKDDVVFKMFDLLEPYLSPEEYQKFNDDLANEFHYDK